MHACNLVRVTDAAWHDRMTAGMGWSGYMDAAMDSAGITSRKDLAAKAGVDATVLGRWYRREVQPDIRNLRKFALAVRRPLLEVLVAAGHITPEEAGQQTVSVDPMERAIREAGVPEGMQEQLLKTRREQDQTIRAMIAYGQQYVAKGRPSPPAAAAELRAS